MSYFRLPPIRVHLFGYLFCPSWLPTAATLLLLALLVSLGFWQLDRAAQKRSIELEFKHKSVALTPESLSKTNKLALRNKTLTVSGYFDNAHTFMLDNKSYRQQHGVHILTPFIVNGANKRLLVNRGFLAVPERQHLPKIKPLEGPQSLSGLINFPGKAFLLKKDSFTQQWPMMIQAVNLEKLQDVLQSPLYPFILLENNHADPSLIQDWQLVNFPSYRHTGYAMQWFALALTLSIIYFKLNLVRIKQ